MNKFEVRIDVTEAVGTGEQLEQAALVVLPTGEAAFNGVVFFGFPGGAYNRRYYDLQLEEGPGYSQAEHHARHGSAFVAIDHLGVGDSSVPDKALDYEAVARGNNAAANEIVRRLAAGTLDPAVDPLSPSATVAMGQSFGGFVLTIGQGRDRCFDGVVFLGWSGIETQPPWPADLSVEEMFALTAGNGLTHPMRPMFHFHDVPESIVVADLTKRGPGLLGSMAAWSTDFGPGGPALSTERGPLGPGVVAAEAAAIDVPVFIGNGEIDVVTDFRAEPAAYRSSPDITTCVYRNMAHMHNFASSRTQLWSRLEHWAQGVAATKN